MSGKPGFAKESADSAKCTGSKNTLNEWKVYPHKVAIRTDSRVLYKSLQILQSVSLYFKCIVQTNPSFFLFSNTLLSESNIPIIFLYLRNIKKSFYPKTRNISTTFSPSSCNIVEQPLFPWTNTQPSHDLRTFILFGLPFLVFPILNPMANCLRLGTILLFLETVSNQIADFYRWLSHAFAYLLEDFDR